MSSFTTTLHPRTIAFLLWSLVLCVSLVSHGECQATTAPPPTPCSAYNSCEACVPQTKCLWCFSNNNCTEYPVSWLLPPASVCPLSQARWSVCWINFEALIIVLGVLGGFILIGIIACCCCCCWCCCCNKRRRPRRDSDEERLNRKREEMRQRSEERKLERKERQDEIRRKYGLMGDKDHPYSKFENE